MLAVQFPGKDPAETGSLETEQGHPASFPTISLQLWLWLPQD